VIPPKEGEQPLVHLRSPPQWFKGWVSIDGFDTYPPQLWTEFEIVLREHQDGLAGGVHGVAAFLHKCSLPAALRFLTLGELRNIVKLSIRRRKGLLSYDSIHGGCLKYCCRIASGCNDDRSTDTSPRAFVVGGVVEKECAGGALGQVSKTTVAGGALEQVPFWALEQLSSATAQLGRPFRLARSLLENNVILMKELGHCRYMAGCCHEGHGQHFVSEGSKQKVVHQTKLHDLHWKRESRVQDQLERYVNFEEGRIYSQI